MRWLFPVIISLSLLTAPQGGFAQTVDELYQQGAAAYELKKYTEAESFFRRVIEIDSRNAKAYNSLGSALSNQGKLEEAISNYKKALALDPKNALAYYNLGVVLDKQGKLEEAISNYKKALAIDPNYAGAYNNLGVVLYKQGKLEEAISNYKKALALDPNYAGAYNNLGFALYKQGKLEEAISNYKKALALDPNFATAQNNLKEAERLLARKTTPPPLNLDDRKYLPSINDEPLLPSLRSTLRIIATGSSEGTRIGAGWVMKREGNIVWIVTCRHVVSDRRTKQPSQKIEIEIELYSELSDNDRPRYSATIEKITSPADNLDIAVLKVSGIPSDVQPLTLKLGRLPRTSAIKIIGHPKNVSDPWTVVSGEVINYNAQNPEMTIDATVGAGNSGGPVINDKGQMIGMMVSIYNRGDVAVDPNEPTPALLDDPGGTGGVGLAYRTEVILQQLKAWGYEL